MGDAQSAQRDGKKDAAEEEEESGTVDEAQCEQNTEDKPLKKNGQISEINGKADSSIAEVNGHLEDETAAEAILSPDEDVSETEKSLKAEETPLENVEIKENESPNEADANEDVPLEMIEMDAKQNAINDSFRRFFSNIGLKLTVKRGSGEIPTDVPDETDKEEPNRPEEVEDTAKETKSDNAEQNTDVHTAQETYDNDSTTCPTLTDVTSEDILENAEEKATETREEVESGNADAATTSPVKEDAHQDATPEEPHSTSPSSPEEEVVVSPIKRFFTTGIFSGLRKKKKPAEDETTEKELVDMGKKEVVETTEQTVQDQQQDKEEVSPGVEAATVEKEHKENELEEEILSAASALMTDERKTSNMDPSTVIVTEPEVMSSQEKDKVQASPLKRLLSGSSLKKLSKKQRSRRSSDAKLSDSGEHVSDQLLSSTESAENQKEGPAKPSAEAAGEEDGAWASFKKLVTPKKRMKRSSLGNEETQIPGSVEEPKPSEGEQISDHSTEEGKKRKDSSVSWEAVLCGSGRRRSRKTSDSEDETPQMDNDDNKQDGGSKHAAELPLESSNEVDEMLASSPKRAGSPSEGDGGSTWKSLKKLVTPKRKAKEEDESKENIQSDSEITQDESSFSIKKLLPGRKKRKSAEKQDQVSSDEADKDVASGDEDSETPAVVPLSEFDTVTEVHIQTQVDVESHLPEDADYELQQDLLDQMAEPVLAGDNLQTETNNVQDNVEALEDQAAACPATNEESDDLTESISKHQQLSDIPEEGIITETMGTPASITEEAARDDTIAEDLIEITSEAITAPEPVDITLADETEMISAVSQLSSQSSKTSGNTTPVPAEYDVMETDVLLQQVVETISISPKDPVCSEELSSERIVGSVSHQILETFVKEEPTVLEVHRRLEATAINTSLNVDELYAINELAATTQTEAITEVNDSVSTEIVSESPSEEFDTAEIVVDEVHKVNVTDTEESIKELEMIDESHQLVERLSDPNVAVSTDIVPEGEETVTDEGSLVEAHQDETEPPKIDSQKADSAATIADETKDMALEQEVLTQTEKEDHIMHSITDQVIQVGDKDQPPVEVEELQELAAVQAASSDPEEGSVQSLEKGGISEDIPEAETVTDEPKEEKIPLSEVNIEPEEEHELETDAAKTEHLQTPEALEAVQASTLDSEGRVQSTEEEVKSEEIPPAETVTDEPKQTVEQLTEVHVEVENKELPVTAVQTEHVQVSEALETVQALILDSEVSVQSLEKEVMLEDVPEAETEESIPLSEVNLEPMDVSKTEHVKEPEPLETVRALTLDSEVSVQSLEKEVMSEDVTEAETVMEEPKEETIPPTEVHFEPMDASKTEHVQVPEALENVQALTLDSEVSVQSLEKVVISEDIPKAETEESIPLSEVNLEPVDASKIEHVQESEILQAAQAATFDSEAGSLLSLENEAIPEDIPAVEDEPKQETELKFEPEDKLPVEAAKTGHVPEPEVLPSDGKEIVTETKTEEEASMYVHVVTESIEGGSAKELEEQILLEDVPKDAIASVTDEIENKDVAQLNQASEITEDQETQSIPQDVQVEQEDHIPEVVDELQTLKAVHVASVNEDSSNVHVLEKTELTEETPAPCVDNAVVTDELKHEVHVSAVQVSIEGEKETDLPGTEKKTAAVEHAVVAEVVVCNLKDVSDAIADVLIEKTSDITEPLIDTVASELVFKEEVEAATPLVVDDLAETAEEGSVVVMMHVPSVKFEDNHRIQVQVVDVDIKSAETIVDTVLQVSLTEAKEVIDVCHETVEKVDNLSATSEIEEDVIHEENRVTIQEVIQHVQENLQETVSKSVVVNLEQEVTKQPDVMKDVSEIAASESNKVEDQKVMEDSTGTFKERQDEAPAVISDDSATEQQVSEDLIQTPGIPGSLDASIHDHKEDLEETKAEQEKSVVTAEEIKSSSEDLGVKEVHEQAQITQIAQCPIVTPSNTGLVVPQNTGIISSIGNVESPSSLSLEFKLNIQFGQVKAPASPPPTTEISEPMKQTVMSEVGVQAVEAVEPMTLINPTQRAESQKQTEVTEVAVQATEITEPAANFDSTERAMIMTQPVLQDVGIQAMETAELVEQIKPTERVTSSVQATETIQPVRQTDKREVFLSHPVLSEACDQETKAEEPVKQTEEEHDQDVWMDAEEVIYTQDETEVSLLEVEGPLKPQIKSQQEEKAGLEHEVETALNSKTEEEENQQEMNKAGETCEIESEGEDFAVAPEHLEIGAASVTAMEWD